MEVPERAVWTRTLLAELNRVLNHLMFLGSYPLELGGITPVFYAFREREELQHVMEEISGGRMHYMFNRVGGLKEDLPAGWTGTRARRPSPTSAPAWTSSTTWCSATRSSGAVPAAWASSPPEAVHAYGVSGPIARASGVDFDLRRDEPYLAYGELQDVLKVVTRERGRLPRPLRVPAGADPQRARPGRRLPGPARRAAARARSTSGCRRS